MDKENPSTNSQTWSFKDWQKRALFLCKRGNLETELLLKSYIHSLNDSLPVDINGNLIFSEKKLIQKTELINALFLESEQNLFHWLLESQSSLTKPVSPVPERYLKLIQEIRDNYLNSNN